MVRGSPLPFRRETTETAKGSDTRQFSRWTLIVISGHDKCIITVGLATFVGEFWNQHGVIMVDANLAVIPLLALFIAVQGFIIEGVVLTDLRG